MMTTTEEIVKAMLQGKITEEEGDLALAISTYVETKITCNLTGMLLDSRTAYAVQLWANVLDEPPKWVTFEVFHPAFLESTAFEGAQDRLTANYGPEDDAWRIVSAADVWEKIGG